MAYVTGTVNLATTPPTIAPDPIPVNQGVDDGVKWQIVPANTTYAFIYVTFNTYVDNFSNMKITEDTTGNCTLQIDDSVANKETIKYNLYYIDKSDPKTVYSIDPSIKNQ